MPSIFDLLFGNSQAANAAGGATPPINPAAPVRPPSILDSADYRDQRLTDALQGLAAGLVQAGAPSPYPRGWAETLGAAGAGIGQGMAGSEDKFLRRAMVNSQVQKNEQELANDKAWRDMFSGAGSQAPIDAGTWKGQPTTATAAAPSSATSGGRPNDPTNPGNLADGRGGFQTFPTPEAGVAAAVKLAQSYPGLYNSGQPMSLAQIEARWAPPDDGKTPQLRGNRQGVWSGNVAKVMGVDPGAPIDFSNPDVALKFAQAVHVAEHGQGKAYAPDVYQRGVQMAYGGLTRTPPAAPVVAAADAPASPPQGDAVPPPVADASGTPVQPVQYTPGAPVQIAQPQAYRPQTMQDVIQTVPPGVRQMIGAMGRKEGMGVLMKYADPGSEAVLDTQTNQIVFIPKTMVGRDARYAPAKGAELDIARQQLANSQRKTDIDERNADVVIGNDGRPVVNQTAVDAKKAVSAAQGTDPASKITVELAQDAIKRNGEWQNAGMKAQSSIGRLGQLQGLLDQVATGRFKGTTTDIKAIAKGAGIDLEAMGVKDDVGPAQAIVALTNLMALENRDPSSGAGMPGAMSDADRNYLQQASVSITKDPAGNKILIETKKGDLRRQVDVAKYAREYMQSKEFKTNPAGLEDYVAEKISGKNYYDASILPQQSNAPPGAIPPPPSGFSPTGSPVPPPPAGFKVVQ